MHYTKDQMVAWRPHGGNTICLAMRPRIGKDPKQMGSDGNNLITVPIKPYNGIQSYEWNSTDSKV